MAYPRHLCTALLLLLLPRVAPGQGVLPVVLPNNSRDTAISSAGLAVHASGMYAFWNTPRSVWVSRGTGSGASWQPPVLAAALAEPAEASRIVAGALSGGRVFFALRGAIYRFWYSDNQGASFSAPVDLPCGNVLNRRLAFNLSLYVAPRDTLYCLYTRQVAGTPSVYFIRSSNGGQLWDAEQLLISNAWFAVMRGSGSYRLLAYQEPGGQVYVKTSTNQGVDWSPPAAVPLPPNCVNYDVFAGDSSFSFAYAFRLPAPGGLVQSDIAELTYNIQQATWLPVKRLTGYAGWDDLPAYSGGAQPRFTYLSSRGSFGLAPVQVCVASSTGVPDTLEPPALLKFSYTPSPDFNMPQQATLLAGHATGTLSVQAACRFVARPDTTVTFYDDGAHSDSLAGDGLFGGILPGADFTERIALTLLAADGRGNTAAAGPFPVIPRSARITPNAMFTHNNYILPFNNAGVLGDIFAGADSIGGRYKNVHYLLGGGFFVSGKNGTAVWANGMFNSARLQDYRPGPVGSDPLGTGYGVYTGSVHDAPFSSSWERWRGAVAYGASFYDGNGDGLYTPVDRNGNGAWDPAEDAPDFLGDMTAWCVFNDGIPGNQRRFAGQNPMGIEIRQSVFSSRDTLSALGSFHAIRYRIINRNPANPVLDSVYFSSAQDADIGFYADDYAGCDTLLQAAFAYNKTPDQITGNEVGSLITGVLQGPPRFQPGITFTDVNSNGSYDEGTDIPLDSAKDFRGPLLGAKYLRGARNAGMASALLISPLGGFGYANTVLELRNLMYGRTLQGPFINPCTYGAGTVTGVPCSVCNPVYMFPADPVAGTGWLQSTATDVRQMVTTGPFRLLYNVPVDIIMVQGVGTAATSLAGVRAVKAGYGEIRGWYRSNWSRDYATGVAGPAAPAGFALLPNYPNPFNPATTVSYTIPPSGRPVPVKLMVYDVLGRLIEILVNEEQQAGSYSAPFNAAARASGVYIIRLEAGEFRAARKMLLLK